MDFYSLSPRKKRVQNITPTFLEAGIPNFVTQFYKKIVSGASRLQANKGPAPPPREFCRHVLS